MMQRLLSAAIFLHLICGVCAAAEKADVYPTRPIRLVDGFAAGGSSDYLARAVAPRLSERLGQTVIVENRPGGGGNIGTESVARATADGYTLLIGATTSLASSRSLYPKLGYDLLKDFAFVSSVGTSANLWVAHPSLPVRSMQELIALARKKPKGVNYGSAGVGSIGHLSMALLESRAGIRFLHVPYKGVGPVIVATTSGEVEVGSGSAPAAVPMIKAKRLIPLAVSSATRLAAFPDVPTVAEAGVKGFNVTPVFAIYAPAGTPAEIVNLLNAEIRKIVETDDIKARFMVQAVDAKGSTSAELRSIVEGEVAQWARVIKEAGIVFEN